MGRLQNKVAIVTGSSSGLGRAIALYYVQEGAHVVCADLQPTARGGVQAEALVATHEQILSTGGRAIFVQTDVSKSADMERLVQKTVEEYGRLDVLVNNAGVSLEGKTGPLRIHETAEETWDTVMAINAKSIFLGCKYAAAQMLKQDLLPTGDRGWIVNISSVYGIVAGRGAPTYSASKGAVSNLTRQVALDYAPDRIHCNAICPGFTNTQMYADVAGTGTFSKMIPMLQPLRGLGEPNDIAGAAVFLASDEARFITGVCLPVDGGYTAQ